MDSSEIFLHNIDTSEKDIIDWNDYRIGYFIQKNQTEGSENQDTLFFIGKSDFCLFGVSDGAGGHPNGKEASYLVGENIFQYVRTKKADDVQLIRLIEEANNNVREKYPKAYTTLAFAALFDNELRSYSVGDSEIQYFNSSGATLYNNIPQSPVGYAVEAGYLSQEEALDHKDRNIVNNLLGDEHLRIEVASKVLLKKGYSVLVGSDGIFDNISHEELAEIIGRGSFDEGFKKLCYFCEEKGENWRKDDDISFVFLRKIR